MFSFFKFIKFDSAIQLLHAAKVSVLLIYSFVILICDVILNF